MPFFITLSSQNKPVCLLHILLSLSKRHIAGLFQVTGLGEHFPLLHLYIMNALRCPSPQQPVSG